MRQSVAVLFVAAFSLISFGSASADESLSGKMASWQQMVGRWSCELKLYPVADQPAGTGPSQTTIEMLRNNTIHVHSVTGDSVGDDYIGYLDSTKRWWDAGVDNEGYATLSTSTDNVVYTQASDATSNVDRSKDLFRVTYRKNGAPDQLQELKSKNGWIRASELTCHKSTENPE